MKKNSERTILGVILLLSLACAVIFICYTFFFAPQIPLPSATFKNPSEYTNEVKSMVDSFGVNINTADQKRLEDLPEIGEVIAERIVEYREENGSFKSVDDLLCVKGIGEKKLEKIRPYIFIG